MTTLSVLDSHSILIASMRAVDTYNDAAVRALYEEAQSRILQKDDPVLRNALAHLSAHFLRFI